MESIAFYLLWSSGKFSFKHFPMHHPQCYLTFTNIARNERLLTLYEVLIFLRLVTIVLHLTNKFAL